MITKWVWQARIVGLLVLVPVIASAQQASGIAGVVRDTSGGVLPGVTVEAASPALIEKIRTAVSDGEGRYNITSLRPGTYSVTFSLGGFNTFKRDGVAITAGFTATVNADMQVGALEETITVTGAAPLVDTQNVKQQSVVSADLLASLPSGSKGSMDLIRLMPGVASDRAQGGGGAGGIYASNATHGATVHGKGSSKVSYDGMMVNNLAGTGATSYVLNPSTVVETTVETGGMSAESNASGIAFNMIPKEGGNLFSGAADFTYSNDSLQSDNLNDELRARGVTSTMRAMEAYDVNVAVGGPVKKDKLWFFTASRFTGTKTDLPGVYVNKGQGVSPFYIPDLDRPAFAKDWLRSQAVRMTWQATPRNKINGFADPQSYHTRGQVTTNAPEANICWAMWPQGLYQGTWSSPVTSKFLLEAGSSLTKNPFPCTREHVTQTYGFAVKATDRSILEQSTGFRYNSAASYSYIHLMDRYHERFAGSYVTGSHAFKVGMDLQQHIHDTLQVVNTDTSYIFNKQVPTTIVQWATPNLRTPRTKADLGLYAQDKWAFKRLTLNYGLRFDYFNGYNPAQHVDATQYVPARDYAQVDNVPNWKDLNSRLGGSYDLFGNGRTALKGSLGRYVGKHSVDIALANNPITTSVNSVTRSWTDANKDYVPNCDLTNFALNGECGKISNVNFGQLNPKAVRYAADMNTGFGMRDYFWDMSAEVQHELRPGLSLAGGYFRNWSNHFVGTTLGTVTGTVGTTDNLAVIPADFNPFCITAPKDSRLPGGGGYPVCGLYDITPTKFGVGDQVIARPSAYDNIYGGNGKRLVQDFLTFATNTRFGGGIQLGASVDTGRSVEDGCFVTDSPQVLLFCRIVKPFSSQTQVKMNVVYPLPKGFVVSAVFQNLSGITYNANYTATTAEIAPSLGRPLAGATKTVVVPLIAPFTGFEPRRNLVDLRVSKLFSLGAKARLKANLDLYNLFNDGSILEINNSYGPQWLQGQGRGGGVMMARLLQFGGSFTF